MSDTKFVRAVTLDRFGDVVNDIKGVDVRHLPPFTTLLVRTMNSLYRVVITQQPEVIVQGGVFFPIRRRPTSMEPASGEFPQSRLDRRRPADADSLGRPAHYHLPRLRHHRRAGVGIGRALARS